MSAADAFPVPVWLLWVRTVCLALSIAGTAVYYGKLDFKRRMRVKHSVLRFFIRAARENRLERVRSAAGAVAGVVKRVYGREFFGIVVVSTMLSLLYLVAALALCGAVSYDWVGLRAEKARIERQVDPLLFATPEAKRREALEETCPVGDHFALPCSFTYSGPQMDQIRAHLSTFDSRYRHAVIAHRQHTEIWILTLQMGTLDGGRGWQALSLLILNVVLDICGAYLVMGTLMALTDAQSLIRMMRLALVSVVVGALLVTMSVSGYHLVSNGHLYGAYAVLAVPLSLLMLGSGIGGVVEIAKSNRTVVRKVLSVAGAALLTVVVTGGVLLFALVPLSDVPIARPAFDIHHPLDGFFYIVAVAAILPTAVGLLCVVLLVAAGTFARTLLGPTMLYLRTVLRMPYPVLITLTAAPAAIAQALVSSWGELHRMLGLN
jgi:hypothetical protein